MHFISKIRNSLNILSTSIALLLSVSACTSQQSADLLANLTATTPTTVTVSATRPILSATLSSANFPNTAVNSTSTLTATISNIGSATAKISASSITGTAMAITTNTCGTELGESSTCSVTFTFSPVAVGGPYTGIFRVDYADTSGTTNYILSSSFTGSVTLPAPSLSVSPSVWNFGSVALGSSSTKTFTLSNLTVGPVSLQASTTSTSPFTITSDTCDAQTITSLTGACTVQVTFTPTGNSVVTDTLVIPASNSAYSKSISLTGSGPFTAPRPILLTSLSSSSFPQTNLNSSNTIVVSVVNSGNANGAIDTAAFTGSGMSKMSDSCSSATLVPGSTCSVTLRFIPTAVGVSTGTFSLDYHDPTSSTAYNVSNTVTGEGTLTPIVITANPTNYDFADITTDSSSTKNFVVTNSSTAVATFQASTVSGTGYTIMNDTCSGATLAAGSGTTTCNVSVKLAPTTTGIKPGQLILNYRNIIPTSFTTNVSLTGTGITPAPPPRPVLASSYSSATFPDTPVNSSSSLTATILNTSAVAAAITSSSITGTGMSISANTCTGTLNPSSSCTITATFSPTTAGGPFTGVLQLNYTGTSGGTSYTLSSSFSGTSTLPPPSLTVSPSVWNFGSVALGSSATKTFTVSNLSIGPATFQASTLATSPFTIVADTCDGQSITSATSTCTVTVSFAPTSSSVVTDTLTIPTTNASYTQTISLTGRGPFTPPRPIFLTSLSASSFPATLLNSSSSIVITVTNSGTASGTVDSAAFTGTGMSKTADTCTTAALTIGATCSVTVRFLPTTIGFSTGTFLLGYTDISTGNSYSVSNTIAGEGTIIAPVIASNPANFDFGTVNTDSNSSKTFIISNTSTGPATFQATGITGSGYIITSDNCSGVTLASGTGSTSCSIAVKFSPGSAGALSGQLTLNYQNSISTALTTNVTLSGIGSIPATTFSIAGGNLQTTAPGYSFADNIKVQLLYGAAPLNNMSVNFTQLSGPTVIFGTANTATDVSGVAQTSVTASTSGTAVIRATYLGYTQDFTLTIADQTNSVIVRISGNGQTGVIGSTLASPLVVETRNAGGTPIANILVRFSVTGGNGRINSSSNTVTVLSDSVGRASVNFDLGTQGGSNTITSNIVSVPAQTVSFTATGTVPTASAVSLSQSSVISATSALVADGSSVTSLTLYTNDSYGNIIPTGGKAVVFSTNVGTLIGGVVDNNNGTYTQTIRSPSSLSISQISVSASINGSPITSSPALINLISGTVSLANSTITRSNPSITANGTDTSLITVTLKDSLGNQLSTGGQAIVISSTMGTLVGSVQDVGNGTYTQLLKAGTVTGTASLTATVGGATITGTTTVAQTAGAPDATISNLIVSPSTISPNGISTSIVTVQLKDAYGNSCTSSTGRTIVLTKTNGTWQSSGTSAVTATDNGNGTYSSVLVSAVTSGNASITATDNGAALTKTATVYFSAGSAGPSVATSVISIIGSTPVAANGTSQITVKLTLKDAFGTQISTGGSIVTLSSTAGTFSGSVIDNADGTYSRVLTAPASAAIATVSATVDGNAVTNTTQVSFYGAISLAQSVLSVSSSSIVANGSSSSTIFLNAKDANGVSIPVGGVTGITFATTFGTLQGTVADNNNGTYSQNIVSSVSSNTATITASKSASAFSSTTTIDFYVSNNRAGLTIDCGNILTYKNTTLLVDNGTLIINSNTDLTTVGGACTSGVTISDFVFNGVILQNSAILTHTGATSSREFNLSFNATYITIDATSKIDVSGKGYTYIASTYSNSRTQTNINSSGTAAAGGSYGGTGSAGGSTYGSIYEPIDLGASGFSFGSGSATSAIGGGRVKITVTGTNGITNAGSIKADGGVVPTGSTGGGAAGGSIWINTTKLTGTGAVTANGSALESNATVHAGGGGGRIAIYYNSTSDVSGNFSYPTNILANVFAKGGIGTGACAGGAGTVYLKSSAQTYGDLIIDNKGLTTCASASTVINSPTITTNQSINSTTLTRTSSFGDTYNTTINPYKNWYIDPNTSQNATAKKADNTLFKIASGTADTVTIASGDMTTVTGVTTGSTYEFVLQFDNIEIGDGTPVTTGNLRMLSYNGDLRSNDSVTAVMNNVIPPKGIEYVGLQTFTANLTTKVVPAFLNEDWTGVSLTLSNGTYNFGTLTATNLTATNMTLTGTKLTTTGNITLDSTTATLTQTVGNLAVDTTGALTLQNTSTLYQGATTSTTEYSLEMSVASLSVSSNSTISASGRGYPMVTGSTFRVYGNQNVSAMAGGTTNLSGGSHGGRGSFDAPSTAATDVWGNIKNPYTSGGAGVYNSNANAGGGIVRINAINSGTLTINGIIDVKGTGAYAGAGGSVYLNAGLVTGAGTGSIDARGTGNSGFAQSAGGRVAIYYSSLGGNFTYPTNALANIKTWGGLGTTAAKTGAAGTLFMKASSETYGKLLVNNNSQAGAYTSYISTVIQFPTIAANTAVVYNSATNQSTITLSNAFAERYGASNMYVGMYLNPNTAQNATVKISDDTMFPIIAQTANTLTVTGNVTASPANAVVGSTFKVNAIFDDVQVVGNAILEVNNGVIKTTEITVNSGNVIGSGSIEAYPTVATTLTPITSGTVNINNIETTQAVTLGAGTHAFTTGASITTGALTLSSAIVTGLTGTMTTGALSLTSSSLTAGIINASGAITLASTSTLTGSGNITVTSGGLSATSSTITQSSGNITITGNIGATSSTITQTTGSTTATGDITATSSTISQAAGTTLSGVNITGSSLTYNGSKIRATGNFSCATCTATLTQTVGNYAIQADGAIDINTTSTFNQAATTTSTEYSLEIIGASFSLGTGCTLNALAKGFPAPANSLYRVFGNQSTTLTWSGATTGYGGGSHGGRGGSLTSQSSEVWGSFKNPYTSGGSGSDSGGNSTPGGGIIRVTSLSNGAMTISGTIDARGTGLSNAASAGGSIYLNGGALSGSGSLDARGGSFTGSSGGGGRIAVYYTSLAGNFTYPTNALANIKAYGGVHATASASAGAGTVFMKANTETYGKLIVNNNSSNATDTNGRRTVINLPTITASSGLTYNSGTGTSTLTLANAFYEKYGASGAFVGMYLNPNTAQNATQKVSDDTMFPIVAQTANTLEVTGNVTAAPASAVAGNTFKVNMKLDELKVVGNGILEVNNGVILTTELDVTNGQIVGSGSVEASPTTTTTLNANAGTININGLAPSGALTLQNGTFAFAAGSTIALSNNITFTSATVTGLSMITGTGNISLSGSSLTALTSINTTGTLTLAATSTLTTTGNIAVTGDVNATSSTITQSTGTILSGANITGSSLTYTGTKIRATGNFSCATCTATLTQTVGSYAIQADGAIDINTASTITQGATTSTTEYSLEFIGSSFNLGTGCTLSGLGKGFSSITQSRFRVFGNQDFISWNSSTNTLGGGSHGGRGGTHDTSSYSSDTFGSYKNPYTTGGAGAYLNNNGSAGGGIIRINTGSGAATIAGTIDVRGSAANSLGGGAGGSIYLNAGALSGAGSLDASGGAATYGGGGGGRIAVYYTSLAGNFTYPTNVLANMRAYGGIGTNTTSASGAAGTVFMKASTDTYGKLIINNNSGSNTTLDTSGRRTVINLPTITTSSGLTYNAGSSTTTLTSSSGTAFSEKYGVSNAFVGMFLNPKTTQNATQKVSDDTMYEITAQTANTLTVSGDATATGTAGDTYQVNMKLDELRVAGNAILEVNNGVILATSMDINAGQVVGTGSVETNPTAATSLVGITGGTINLNSITTTGALTLQTGTFVMPNNATITTGGNLTFTSATMSGTGIGLAVTGTTSLSASTLNTSGITSSSDITLSSASSVTATGNVTSTSGGLSLSGSTITQSAGTISAGTSIALTSASTLTTPGAISAGTTLSLNASTLNQSVGSTITTGGNFTVGATSSLSGSTLNIGGNMLVDSNSTVTTGNRVLTPFTTYNTVSNVNVTGDTTISNTSTLTSPATTSTAEYYLYVTTPNFTLDATSTVNLNGKGYPNVTLAKFRSLGNADYLGYNGASSSTSNLTGGSYGGVGGLYNATQYSNKSYGSFKSPIFLGTSSTCGVETAAGCSSNGGGAFRLAVSGTSLINGTISATSSTSGYSSGSGGSILINTGILSGSGVMNVNAPQTGGGNAAYTGGGGGRMAIYYTTLSGGYATNATLISSLQAYGGYYVSSTNARQYGAAGTIYLKQSAQTYGDMIVNNNAHDSGTTSVATFFYVPASTASSALTTTSLTATSAFSNIYGNIVDFFSGYYFNPNTGQNATNKLSDETVFPVTSNTADVLTTTTSGVTSVASATNNFKLHLIFDNLEVVGKARVDFTGHNIRVISGDLSSNNATSFVPNGGITANVVDLGASTAWTTTNLSPTPTTKCGSGADLCP